MNHSVNSSADSMKRSRSKTNLFDIAMKMLRKTRADVKIFSEFVTKIYQYDFRRTFHLDCFYGAFESFLKFESF